MYMILAILAVAAAIIVLGFVGILIMTLTAKVYYANIAPKLFPDSQWRMEGVKESRIFGFHLFHVLTAEVRGVKFGIDQNRRSSYSPTIASITAEKSHMLSLLIRRPEFLGFDHFFDFDFTINSEDKGLDKDLIITTDTQAGAMSFLQKPEVIKVLQKIINDPKFEYIRFSPKDTKNHMTGMRHNGFVKLGRRGRFDKDETIAAFREHIDSLISLVSALN